jgi:hypothetical protein
MLRYIFFSAALFGSVMLSGQAKEEVRKPTQNLPKAPQGITVGVNLAGPFNSLMHGDRSGFSFVSRFNLAEDYFFVGEAGFEQISFEKEEYDYESNGTFLKAGIEKDMLNNKRSVVDNLLVGVQYGFAVQSQFSSYFWIDNGYWADYEGSISYETLTSHWFELSIGPRAEIFKNFYIGWKIQLRVFLLNTGEDVLTPYIVPGFGSGDNSVNAAFSYTLEYMIPWKK